MTRHFAIIEVTLMVLLQAWSTNAHATWLTADPLYLGDPERCIEDPVQCNLYSYARNDPIGFTDRDGKDAVFIAYPDYKIDVGVARVSKLGHAGVLLINNKTGFTRYYEYGRYTDSLGTVRRHRIANVKMGQDGLPDDASLMSVLKELSKKAGKNGRVEGAYIRNKNFRTMQDYAVSREKDNARPDRKPYHLLTNNCGTFAARAIESGDVEIPKLIDPRPNSQIEEMQKAFPRTSYNPTDGTYISPRAPRLEENP